ncbi:uncharacterized protein [Clytia hemisphaerica]|uniref:Cnidarian restricted protein n=1 Tax=Clytia hemisphaerica TaxID=252671 RepID=A0A7M5UFX4_9CNID|eukprot:TCONS_00066133-protein
MYTVIMLTEKWLFGFLLVHILCCSSVSSNICSQFQLDCPSKRSDKSIGFRLISIHGENSNKQQVDVKDDVIERLMADGSLAPGSFLPTRAKKEQEKFRGVPRSTKTYGDLRRKLFQIRNFAFLKNEQDSLFNDREDLDLPYGDVSPLMENLPFAKFEHLDTPHDAKEPVILKNEYINLAAEQSQEAAPGKKIDFPKLEKLVLLKNLVKNIESSASDNGNSLAPDDMTSPFSKFEKSFLPKRISRGKAENFDSGEIGNSMVPKKMNSPQHKSQEFLKSAKTKREADISVLDDVNSMPTTNLYEKDTVNTVGYWQILKQGVRKDSDGLNGLKDTENKMHGDLIKQQDLIFLVANEETKNRGFQF